MHPNADVLTRLFTALDRHDHAEMAACYDDEATFKDIAFELSGKKRIHAMWHMICDGDIRTTFKIVQADDRKAVVDVVDDYTFQSKRLAETGPKHVNAHEGRRVHNVIRSEFRFEKGRIVDQQDACDPRQWASQAIGGVGGFLAGRMEFLRRRKATKKLDGFIQGHAEYKRH